MENVNVLPSVGISESQVFPNIKYAPAVGDRHASLQYVVLLFNVFLKKNCSADETLQKMSF